MWTRAQGRLYSKQLRASRRLQVLKHYGGDPPKCACCGEATIQFLGIDHINGRPFGERREDAIRGAVMYYEIIKQGFPEGLQVLCHNCNMAKGFYGRCPHEDTRELEQLIRSIPEHATRLGNENSYQ